MENTNTVSDYEIEAYDAILENAYCMDDDQYESLALALDPDGRIYNAWVARNAAKEAARRMVLSENERHAEDVETARLVEKGMQIFHKIAGY